MSRAIERYKAPTFPRPTSRNYPPDAPAVRRLILYVVHGGADDSLSLGLDELFVHDAAHAEWYEWRQSYVISPDTNATCRRMVRMLLAGGQSPDIAGIVGVIVIPEFNGYPQRITAALATLRRICSTR